MSLLRRLFVAMMHVYVFDADDAADCDIYIMHIYQFDCRESPYLLPQLSNVCLFVNQFIYSFIQ